MAKRTKIIIEIESLLILRGRHPRSAWCPLCAAEGEMIALEDAGPISNMQGPELERWLSSTELHRLQEPMGRL